MNYFKLIVPFLASASLVSAAANPRADANGTCVFTLGDLLRLQDIVEGGDDPAPLAKMVEGCASLRYNSILELWVFDMIRLDRPALFQFVFPLVDFAGDPMRNDHLYECLQVAMRTNSIAIADYLLGRGLGIEHYAERGLWFDAATSRELLKLLKSHPEQAAGLSPTRRDMGAVKNVEHARVLVEAAKFCDAVTGRDNFDATGWLEELVVLGYAMKERDLAEVAHYLIQAEGARLSRADRDRLARRPGVLQWLQEWSEVEVKDPGHL